MKESIGLTFTINIMIVFILVAFVFIAGTISYSRAFKANSLIVKSLENFEGYNSLSKEQIDRDLANLGYYQREYTKCSSTRNSSSGTGTLQSVNNSEIYDYCIYYFNNDGDEDHYSYGVVSYMTIDFSMFGIRLRIPVYARTTRIYRFDVQSGG